LLLPESICMLRRLYDWTMARAADPAAELWLAAISFMESSFFPIPPHAMLAPMCLARPERALRYGLVCTLASVIGGLFGYWIGYALYESVGLKLLDILGLAKSFPVAACYLRDYGAQIILIKGATPIPFKLITITAGFIHFNLVDFIWATTLSRGFQFLLVAGLFWKFGAPIKAFIDKYLVWVCAAFALAVVGGFLLIGTLGGHKKTSSCEAATMETLK
jgi:membrane protein YqaA with SNARE-associated domain